MEAYIPVWEIPSDVYPSNPLYPVSFITLGLYISVIVIRYFIFPFFSKCVHHFFNDVYLFFNFYANLTAALIYIRILSVAVLFRSKLYNIFLSDLAFNSWTITTVEVADVCVCMCQVKINLQNVTF